MINILLQNNWITFSSVKNLPFCHSVCELNLRNLAVFTPKNCHLLWQCWTSHIFNFLKSHVTLLCSQLCSVDSLLLSFIRVLSVVAAC